MNKLDNKNWYWKNTVKSTVIFCSLGIFESEVWGMVSRRFWQDFAGGRIRINDGLLWQRAVHLPREKPNKTEQQTEHGAAQKPIAKRRENATKSHAVAFVLFSQYQFVIWFSCAQVNSKRNGNAAENATGCAGKVNSKPNSFAYSTRAGRFRLLSWRLWDMPPSVSDVRGRDTA